MRTKIFLLTFVFFLVCLSESSSAVDFESNLLAGYEPNEINSLTVTTDVIKDPTLVVSWPVLGGVNDVPEATEGDYVLKLAWTNETDPNKVEVGHHWNDFTFDLNGVDFIHADVYVADESAISDTNGIGIWDNLWTPRKWFEAACVPRWTNRWYAICIPVPETNNVDLDHIESLLFEDLGDYYGTIYVDNLRLGPTDCNCVRTMKFSEYRWSVLQSDWPMGVGPNLFTDEPNDVWVDRYGNAHLSIVYKDPNWYCSELVGNKNLGYGQYIFTVKASEKMLDPNIVLGLFIFDVNDENDNPQEIDFELSRWWDANEPNNAQYVVQPWNEPNNRYRFHIDEYRTTTHEIIWTPRAIDFCSYYGDFPLVDSNNLIDCWSYTGDDIPLAGTENPRINLWLLPPASNSPKGTPGDRPSDGQDAQIVIKNFLYLPVPGDLNSDEKVDFIDLALFAKNWLVGFE